MTALDTQNKCSQSAFVLLETVSGWPWKVNSKPIQWGLELICRLWCMRRHRGRRERRKRRAPSSSSGARTLVRWRMLNVTTKSVALQKRSVGRWNSTVGHAGSRIASGSIWLITSSRRACVLYCAAHRSRRVTLAVYSASHTVCGSPSPHRGANTYEVILSTSRRPHASALYRCQRRRRPDSPLWRHQFRPDEPPRPHRQGCRDLPVCSR